MKKPIRFGVWMKRSVLGVLTAMVSISSVAAADAPYVDSKAIRERFDQITTADMETLRSKKILFASRSFGLNLFKGLTALTKIDAKYEILDSYKRYDVFKAGSDLSVIPADAFGQHRFVHFLATYWPLTKRVEEMNHLLSDAPHEFGQTVDVVMIYYHTAEPGMFDAYAEAMAGWQKTFPKAKFIYVTSGFMGPKYAAQNEKSHAFGEKAREKLKGRVPLYDLGAILSDDFRVGQVYCPEYSSDPAEVHPNLTAGETMMAKGFLLVLKETFAQKAGTTSAAPTSAVPAKTVAIKPEVLPADHPEAKAVRVLLDANGLNRMKVENVCVVEKGRVVELFLQEAGVTEITGEIGTLTALRKLHAYGDRSLGLPLLNKVSPAIGRCILIEELLLNQNDLKTLPAEIANLQKIKIVSIADNSLDQLPAPALKWAERFDPDGLKDQNRPPAKTQK